MYRQDGTEMSYVDPDDLDFEADRAQEWFSDTMSRVVPPVKTKPDLPQLLSPSPGRILLYLGTILWLLMTSSAKSFKEGVQGICTWLLSIVLPQIILPSGQSYVQNEHLGKIKKKWSKVGRLPTYTAQEEGMDLLQEISHDGKDEVDDGFLHPDEAPVKTMVKLLLDQRGRPHVQCILEGVPVTFLVDSGASASILSFNDFCKIKHRDTLIKSYATPKLYDHQHREIAVKYNVMCQGSFEGTTILMSLLVSSASTSNVLGMDTLVGRSLIFTHRGTDAYLIVGECKAEKRPVMRLPEKPPLYIMEDTHVPPESLKTIYVTPCVYPMHVDIPDSYMEVDYIAPAENFEGRTKHVKLDEEGKAKLRICNRGLVDLVLHANSVIATGTFLPDFTPLPVKKVKPKKAQSEKPIEQKEKPEVVEKAASVHEVLEAPEEPTIQPTQLDEKGPEKVDCFCNLPETNIVIRGNKFGDTHCAHISAGSYTRSPISGCEKFKLGKKHIFVLYGQTKKEFQNALQNSPKEDVAYIAKAGEKQDTDGRKQVILTGHCTEHPFDYSLKPSFISFCRTFQGKHLKVLQNMSQRKILDVLNVKVEMCYDPEHEKQLHYILHVPDILVLKEQWLGNLVAALVHPFHDSVRILEPYLFQDESSNHRSTMFNGILQKVANLHTITLQGRMPHLEPTYDLEPLNIKNCTCEYCMKCRDALTYNMKGPFDVQENKDFLR